jgi:vacuolar protein sorting-associated protein 54
MEHTEIVRQSLSLTRDSGKDLSRNALARVYQPNKALSTNAILQEKLAQYMHVVEGHFSSSLSGMSTPFFAALDSLQDLQAEAAESVVRITELRYHLERVDTHMALLNLEIIRNRQRRDRLSTLSDAVTQLQYIRNGVMHCEKLVDSGQFALAMRRIPYVEILACGKRPPALVEDLQWLMPGPLLRLFDLRRLPALRELLHGLGQLHLRIASAYETQLTNILISDLHQHVSRVSPTDTLSRWVDAPDLTPAYMAGAEKLRADLAPVLRGLAASGCLAEASPIIHQTVAQEIMSLLHQHLPGLSEDDDEFIASTSTRTSSRRLIQRVKSSIVSHNLRALSPDEAAASLTKVCCNMSEALRSFGLPIKIVLDVVTVSTSQQDMTQALDVSDLLHRAVNRAQSEVAKVLQVRMEQTINFEFDTFPEFLKLGRLFANECEAVSGHNGTTFKSVMNDYCQKFLALWHEEERQKLAQRMESEKWERVNFNPESAVILAGFLESMNNDPSSWRDYVIPGTADLGAEKQGDKPCGDQTSTTRDDRKAMTLAVIGQESFMMVDSAAFALRGIERYMIFLVSAPHMAKSISAALFDYLKLFNSRTQKLILGAAAKMTAGLATINAKHLALTSQSLSFFLALIPYMRGCVQRLNADRSTKLEHDRVEHVFRVHQTLIYDNFIDIMRCCATVCVRAMDRTEWDDPDEIQRTCSPCVEMLAAETLTLNRVLSKYLPGTSAEVVMRRALLNYRNYSAKFSTLRPPSRMLGERGEHLPTAKKLLANHFMSRLLRNVEFLEAKLDNIDVAEDFGAYLVEIVEGKTRSRPAGVGSSV